MASSSKPTIQAFKAGADLSAHKFKLVKLSDKETIALCGDGERAIGVLMNAPAQGETAEVAIHGGAMVKVASNATLGASVQSGASGVGADAGAAKWCIGVFTDSGVSGDVVSIEIDRHNSPA